tara:strand:+ start:34 stop:525 length:492 start_codon:yes stop_codon:yes gene_type:complete
MKTIIYDKEIGCIYLRYYKGELMYVGETKNFYGGRPFRIMKDSPVDKVILLEASKNLQRRHYWESYLIVKLKPKLQKMEKYEEKLKKENCENKMSYHRLKRYNRINKRWGDNARKVLSLSNLIKMKQIDLEQDRGKLKNAIIEAEKYKNMKDKMKDEGVRSFK